MWRISEFIHWWKNRAFYPAGNYLDHQNWPAHDRWLEGRVKKDGSVMSCEKENCLWASYVLTNDHNDHLSINPPISPPTNLLLFSHSSIALSTHLLISIHLSTNPSASIYAYLLTYSIYLAIHPSIHPYTLSTYFYSSIYPSLHLSVYPSIHIYPFTLSTHSYTSIHPSLAIYTIYPLLYFIHLFTHLSIHLSINIFIHPTYILFSFSSKHQ